MADVRTYEHASINSRHGLYVTGWGSFLCIVASLGNLYEALVGSSTREPWVTKSSPRYRFDQFCHQAARAMVPVVCSAIEAQVAAELRKVPAGQEAECDSAPRSGRNGSERSSQWASLQS